MRVFYVPEHFSINLIVIKLNARVVYEAESHAVIHILTLTLLLTPTWCQQCIAVTSFGIGIIKQSTPI
jgi:hypothetical protein